MASRSELASTSHQQPPAGVDDSTRRSGRDRARMQAAKRFGLAPPVSVVHGVSMMRAADARDYSGEPW